MTSKAVRPSQILFLLLGCSILIFIRDPAFLIGPRIWAEEGSIYIQSLLDHGVVGSLIKPHLGYYSLYNNVVVALSVEMLSLKWAAYGTTALSFLFTLICVTVPLFTTSRYWGNYFTKITITIFAVVVSSPEIWLNTINIQFYLGSFCTLLLLSEIGTINRAKYTLVVLVVAVGSLTSVTSIILIPFYLLKAIGQKNSKLGKRWRDITAILCVGFLVQLYSYTSTLDVTPVQRLNVEHIASFPEGVLRTAFYILKGNSQTVSIIFGAVMGLWGIISFIKFPKIRYIAILSAYTSVVFTLLSLEMIGGGRYGYAPSVLIVVYFINSINFERHTYSIVGFVIIGLFLIYKLQFYFVTENYYAENWRPFSSEYEFSTKENLEYVRIFPHWENTDWKIKIDRN